MGTTEHLKLNIKLIQATAHMNFGNALKKLDINKMPCFVQSIYMKYPEQETPGSWRSVMRRSWGQRGNRMTTNRNQSYSVDDGNF